MAAARTRQAIGWHKIGSHTLNTSLSLPSRSEQKKTYIELIHPADII